jgi:hypothetical protein
MGWIKTLNVDLYTTGSTLIAVGSFPDIAFDIGLLSKQSNP